MEKGGTIRIIMDPREVNETLRQTLLIDPSVKLEISTLKTGDFLINDLLLVERKTFRDFVASIKDSRIFKQATRLACGTNPTVLILEGTSQDIRSTEMKREAIQGALICLSVKFRIPVLRSLSPEETVKLMIAAYHQLTNCKDIYPPGHPRSKGLTSLNNRFLFFRACPELGRQEPRSFLINLGQ